MVFMTLKEYSSLLFDTLNISDYQDISLNGVQIDAEDREIKRAAFAVDASLSAIQRAVEWNADILVVHHGIFWGQCETITGDHYKRVAEAIKGGLMLYGVHIPLDANEKYGNNAVIADALNLKNRVGFGLWKGKEIGVMGELEEGRTLRDISDILSFDWNRVRIINPKNKETFSSIAVVSGSGSGEIEEAIERKTELLITGEIKHDVYWKAYEAGLSVLAGGHYRTETFGVKALMEMTKSLGIESMFIEEDTGL